MTTYSETQQKIAAKIQGQADKSNWLDWKWQMSNSIRDVATFERLLGVALSPEFKAKAEETVARFPMSVTPYYFSLIDINDYQNDPVFKQCFPSHQELDVSEQDLVDPLSEDEDSPAPGITHRYPDRVLFHVSNTCSMYCRHCTRKRKVGDKDFIPRKEELQKGIDYIRRTPVIRDVLLSGGDPFLLSDEKIDWLLSEVRAIPHVEIVRIGTRTPAVLPFRITDDLITILKKYHPLWLNTHFNHPKEVTPSSQEALAKLADAGIPLGNQSVLLAGVNDCPVIMRALVHKLTRNRVRPYYLYQCDLSEGLTHFRTSVAKGIEIMESLIGHTSGFAVPRYVVDAPGGGGKIPVMPNYLISESPHKVILRNYEGVITTYQEPKRYLAEDCNGDCSNCVRGLKCEDSQNYRTTGVAKLLASGEEGISLTPEHTERMERRNVDTEDKLASLGHSLIHHGLKSQRVYLLKLHSQDASTMADRLEMLAEQHKYTKLLARVPASAVEFFPGWIQEARVPGFYNLEEDGVFLAKYLAPWRREDDEAARIKQIVTLAKKKANQPVKTSLPKGCSVVQLGAEHADDMAALYDEVFASYPFPILNPDYIRETMNGNILYYGVTDKKGKLMALASADMDEKAQNVEMTDFATRKRHRNLGLAGVLLHHMDMAMREKGLKISYSIGRSSSPGINVTFARAGYQYAGTLVNNSHIAGGLSSMNVWFKKL